MTKEIANRQTKYLSKIRNIFKRVCVYVPKNKAQEIKDFAEKLRDEFKNKL